MWQVTIEEYNRMAQDSFPAELEYFRERSEALDFIYNVMQTGCNCSIWLEELIPCEDNPDEYMNGNDPVCFQSISFD